MFGSLAVWMNIRKLHRDKQVRGICWQLSFFFSSWGLWNLYYYFMLRQYLSWVCSMSLALANLIWLGQAVYYKHEERWSRTGNRVRFHEACDVATKVTNGRFYCSRDEFHDGPCAAWPVDEQRIPNRRTA